MPTGQRVEVEAKYEVTTPGTADGYLVAPELGPFSPIGSVRSVRMEDRYVDTADWTLARAGIAARLRRGRNETRINLKSRRSSGTRLHRREETEGPADNDLVPARWPASPARARITELCGDAALHELLTIKQIRRVRKLRADSVGETRAELSVDEVEVRCGDRLLDRYQELEVELISGDESALLALADELDRDARLRRSVESKLEKAVTAVRAALPALPDEVQRQWQSAPEAPAPAALAARNGTSVASPARAGAAAVGARTAGTQARSRSLGIQAADTMPEAAQKILASNFRKMKAFEPGARSGIDSEDLHDMRVATRRIRAAWRVFEGAFKPGRLKKLRREMESVADRLGVVRDLDVLIADLDAYRAGLDEAQRPALEPLASLWRKQRADARDQLLGDLDSAAYAGFLESMEGFLDDGANAAARVAGPTEPHRVLDCAASRIWAAYEAVRVYELVLPWADVETLHALRIDAKRLRYSLEFFAEVLGPDAGRLLERVVALQDHLGGLHDADVASKLTRDLLVARAGELSRTETDEIAAYMHYREREVARRRRALAPVWRAVDGAPFRRALGRATAAL